MNEIQKSVTDEDVIAELKDMQRVSDRHDALCLNEAIHALQEKSGIHVKPGDTYYLILHNRIKKQVCQTEFADNNLACDVFETEFDAEYELRRRDIIYRMNRMSSFPNSICQYELGYDKDRDEVIVMRIEDRKSRRPYFISEDDAYACLLSIGEPKIRKYYLGVVGKHREDRETDLC